MLRKKQTVSVELMKAREKMREQDSTISELQKERQIKELEWKELETVMVRRPQTLDIENLLKKLNTKVKKCTDLSFENNELRANDSNIEG